MYNNNIFSAPYILTGLNMYHNVEELNKQSAMIWDNIALNTLNPWAVI